MTTVAANNKPIPSIELTGLSNPSLTTLQTSNTDFTADTAGPLLGNRRDSSVSAASASTLTPSILPASDSAAFAPTIELQLQTPGKPWLSFPTPIRADPIPIFSVSPATGTAERPRFISYRPARRSGNCFLVDAEDDRANPARLAETRYRFGPGKHPRLRIARDVRGVIVSEDGEVAHASSDIHADVPPPYSAEKGDVENPNSTADADVATDGNLWEEVEISSLGTFTRAQSVTFPSLGGTFQWRYGGKRERAAYDAHNLLILEWVGPARGSIDSDGAGPSRSSKKEQETRVRVAQLVRNEAYRTPGTGASTAGNGGRIMVDLDFWSTGKDAEASGARDRALAMVTATALVMLKKEVDRRRLAQIAIMSGAGSGGP